MGRLSCHERQLAHLPEPPSLHSHICVKTQKCTGGPFFNCSVTTSVFSPAYAMQRAAQGCPSESCCSQPRGTLTLRSLKVAPRAILEPPLRLHYRYPRVSWRSENPSTCQPRRTMGQLRGRIIAMCTRGSDPRAHFVGPTPCAVSHNKDGCAGVSAYGLWASVPLPPWLPSLMSTLQSSRSDQHHHHEHPRRHHTARGTDELHRRPARG